MYNLSNLEPKFKIFLRAENISDVSLRNYLSDIRHFIGWIVTKNKFNHMENFEHTLSKVNPELIEEYKSDHIKSALPRKTANRRLSALRKFFLFCQKEALLDINPAKQVSNISLAKKINKLVNQEIIIKAQNKSINPEDSKAIVTSNKWSVILFSTLLIVIALFIFLLKNTKPKVGHIPVVAPEQNSNRKLLFNGRIRDNLGNVITTKTDVTFNLYNQPDGGKPLYTSSCIGETGAITPDVNGNVRIVIGSDCDGKSIPSKLFSENPNIYLGITISSDAEMKPRQKIPNVGYAKNSDTVQGFSLGSNKLTVPYINEDGDLLIAVGNAGIRSTYESTNFSISSAESVTIQAASTGDVVLEATGSGGIKLRTGGLSDSYSRLFINEEGKIGIGTLSPSYDLEVSGDVKITDGNKLIIGSSSYDPTGINGAIYYNTKFNRIRCFQDNVWTDCFTQSEKATVGGIATPLLYDGKLENANTSDLVDEKLLEVKNILSDKITALLTTSYELLATNISVREKITSPVVETEDLIATGTAQIAKVETSEIRSPDGELILNLNNDTRDSTSEVNDVQKNTSEVRNENKGPLATLIIRGLEGKTVAAIDAAGNASYSGQLAADTLLIHSDATIEGNLRAKEIEAENINSIQSSLVSNQQELSKLTTDNRELTTNVNEVQKLLADIKNQPLSDPQYYQKITSSVIASDSEAISLSSGVATSPSAPRNDVLESLKVTGSSNLYNLTVTNSEAIGSILIQDNSLLSLAWDLKLSALSTIKLFEEAVVISKDGTITTKGKVVAEAGIKTNKIEPINEGEKVTINNLAVNNLAIENKYLPSTESIIASADNFARNGLSSPAIETQIQQVGVGFIPAGEPELIIYNNTIKEDSLIYLTPTSSSPVGNLTVVKKESCSFSTSSNSNYSSSEDPPSGGDESRSCKPYFKVAVENPAEIPIAFNWLIIN